MLLEEAEKYQDTMTEAERMKAYAEGKEVDRIPFIMAITESQAGIYGYTMQEYRCSAEVQVDVARKAKKDFHFGGPVATVKFGWRGAAQAIGSIVESPENNIENITDFVLKDYEQLRSLTFDPANNNFLSKSISMAKEIQKLTDGKSKASTRVSGPMSVAIAVRKPELFLRDMIRDKENAHRLLDFCVDCNLKWVKYVSGIFGNVKFSISDPASAGNLISAKMFREFSKPHLKRMIDGIKEITGTIPGLHICGKTKAIWQDLAELKFPSFSVDNCEDLSELKAAVGNTMTIVGNVPPTTVLRNGTIDDVIMSVKECLIKGSDSPCGYTLMPGCQIPPGTPKENLLAYTYAARRYGRGARMGHLCRGIVEEALI